MKGLDKYLTTEPESGFDGWSEDVIGMNISNMFFDLNEKWLLEWDGVCNKWLNKLFDKGVNPSRAAAIIERAHSIYKL